MASGTQTLVHGGERQGLGAGTVTAGRAAAWAAMLRSMVRVLQDSSRTPDIHVIEDVCSAGRFRALLDAARASGEGAEVLRARPELDGSTLDVPLLRGLGEDTLGGAYVRHLERNGLGIYEDPLSFEFVQDPDVRYLIHRWRQTHDLWHVLLGLGAQGYEEVLVHTFALGHLRLPISALIVGFGVPKHLVLEGRWGALRHGVSAMYRAGRDARPLLLVPWEQLWDRPLDELRRAYRIRPYAASP
jgi:ubiquinone biosynthesis protein COQ4